MNHRIRALACWLGALVFAHCLAAQSVITVDHGPNAEAQQAKPYVVRVSLDGFRYDSALQIQPRPWARCHAAPGTAERGASGKVAVSRK